MQPRTVTPRGVALTVGFVAVSSFLGLTKGDVTEWRFVVDVWSQSVWADLIFALGSAFVALYAYRLAARAHPLLCVLASFALHWTVYTTSFYALPNDFAGPEDEDVFGVARFILEWGYVGLIFAAAAPAATDRLVARRRARTDASPAVV